MSRSPALYRSIVVAAVVTVRTGPGVSSEAFPARRGVPRRPPPISGAAMAVEPDVRDQAADPAVDQEGHSAPHSGLSHPPPVSDRELGATTGFTRGVMNAGRLCASSSIRSPKRG